MEHGAIQMIKYVILVLMLLSSSTNTTGPMKLDFTLHNVNKISIESAKYSLGPYHKIVITTPEDIKFIINELNNIKDIDGIETSVQYKVILYEDKRELLVLGLNMDLDYPSSSFIRQSIYTKDNELHSVNDYLISRSFFYFLKDKLQNKIKGDKSNN
jgi:hypothetical protein